MTRAELVAPLPDTQRVGLDAREPGYSADAVKRTWLQLNRTHVVSPITCRDYAGGSVSDDMTTF